MVKRQFEEVELQFLDISEPKEIEELEDEEVDDIEEHIWDNNGKYMGIATQDAKAGDIVPVFIKGDFVVSGCSI